jgi:HSP20 family protein
MATRNSNRNDDRSSSRSASNAGASSSRREAAQSAPSSSGGSGSRQNSGVNTGIGGIGSTGANASNTTAGPESRGGASQAGGATTSSSSQADRERQLRTSREEGGTRASSRGNIGQPQQEQHRQQQQQQQGRPVTTPGYYSGGSPFAMMRRMMDDMDRLFSDFGFAQPGWMSSSLFGPDVWSSFDNPRALGAGQQSSGGQQRALSGQSGSQQGLQRAGQSGGLQSWQQGLWSPQVEVRERGNNIVVRADLPGLSRDDVDVEVDDDTLIIRGERHNDWEDQNEQEGYYRSERSYGTFYRAIPLPEGVDPNACNATFKDGVLEVTLPKPKEAQSKGRKIEVR